MFTSQKYRLEIKIILVDLTIILGQALFLKKNKNKLIMIYKPFKLTNLKYIKPQQILLNHQDVTLSPFYKKKVLYEKTFFLPQTSLHLKNKSIYISQNT